MHQLDREGVFKALPMSWGLQASEQSQSVALVVTFKITAQFDGGSWLDWTQFEDHEITGWFYIVKRDGQVNAATVENLVKSIGWTGSLDLKAGPPEITCQITTAFEEYNGKSSLKVKWLNPEDFTPGPKTADDATVKNLQARYGAQLRAAAASAAPKATATPKASPPPPRAAAPAATDATEDDLPFEPRPAVEVGDAAAGHGAGEAATTSGRRVGASDTPASDFLGGLQEMGFFAHALDEMSIEELRRHANIVATDAELGERRMIRAALEGGDRDKVIRCLTIISQRKAAAA